MERRRQTKGMTASLKILALVATFSAVVFAMLRSMIPNSVTVTKNVTQKNKLL
jgi:Na+-transporting NADH:ubiquinone oxidoreductase subunit NqrD